MSLEGPCPADRAAGRGLVLAFVPGHLLELVRSFGLSPVLPGAAPGPPERPDLVVVSHGDPHLFDLWLAQFQRPLDCPVLPLHLPSRDPAAADCRPVVRQLEVAVIPALERLTGSPFRPERLAESLRHTARAEGDLLALLDLGRRRPSPVDACFDAAASALPVFDLLRGTPECAEHLRILREEAEARTGGVERLRLVLDGAPPWAGSERAAHAFRAAGAVVVASRHARGGGLYDGGFRHDPLRPLESVALFCMGYRRPRPPDLRLEGLVADVAAYAADGFILEGDRAGPFSPGGAALLREAERRTRRSGLLLPPGGGGERGLETVEAYLGGLERTLGCCG